MKKPEYIKPAIEAISINVEKSVLTVVSYGNSSDTIDDENDFGRSKYYDDDEDWDY